MEPSLSSALKVIVGFAVILLGLSLVGVKWSIRLRILAVLTIGIIFIGFGAYPLVKPEDPLGPITIFTGRISAFDTIICLALAYLAGLLSFFASAPFGNKLAPLAAPAGLAIWALHPGDMTSLIRINPTLAQRQALFVILRWEGIFWFGIVAAGFLGVFTASALTKANLTREKNETQRNTFANKALMIIMAFVSSIVIANLAIAIFAQDVKMPDKELGSVIGQPSIPQIAFAVLIAFTLAAFVVKYFLELSYIYAAIATALVAFLAITIASKSSVLAYMVERWPITFYARSICAITPLQMVAFGAIGAVAGFLIAEHYKYWRLHND